MSCIGIIAEDSSDVDVAVEILTKYLDRNAFSIKKFAGGGCGTLRRKCSAWAHNLVRRGCEHILVFHDLDENKENELRETLRNEIPPREFPSSLIVIPVKTIEAWLLADSRAIAHTFGLNKQPKRIADCETIQRPKDHLRDLAWRHGKVRYLNTAHNKIIASATEVVELRRCQSFIPLETYVLEQIVP